MVLTAKICCVHDTSVRLGYVQIKSVVSDEVETMCI
jgi:hypothetical protein